MAFPRDAAGAAAALRLPDPDAVVELVGPGAQLVVPIANGEPVELLDALERGAHGLEHVRVHQMHALHDRPSIRGEHGDHLRHVAYFLSPVTRPHADRGACDVVPCNFSEVPLFLRDIVRPDLVLAAASPMDRHGYFSLGTNADYAASLIGRVPFVLEVNPQMPRTHGRNTVHLSQILGWIDCDRPLVEVPPRTPTEIDVRIAELIADRIPDGATLQAGIGAIPNAVLDLLGDHRDLGLHTELLSDGVVALAERGVLTGTRKSINPLRMVTTFALGTRRTYDFIADNPAVELWPVDYVNDPRVIARNDRFVSINATIEIDLLGQCASETMHGRCYSGSGGQADFARGALYSTGGQGFVVLHSTTGGGATSRIVPGLAPGTAVTTSKNTVDKVVTEHGVAELRGRTMAERARALIRVAHPDHRDALADAARGMGLLP
jgi:acyl-CoA hydrolase